MVLIAWKHDSRLVQGIPSGDLCLRIVGTARDGQVVRLAAPKCTIGSARGCTLRLHAAGVRPVHCVILRGVRGTVARCWSGGTRLNGRSFVDAPLVAGDRLAIGPIELEVLSSTAADAARDEPRARAMICESSPPQSRRPDDQRARVDRQRVRKLIAAVRGLQAENARLRERAELDNEASPNQAKPANLK
jgi:hypothetical protein